MTKRQYRRRPPEAIARGSAIALYPQDQRIIDALAGEENISGSAAARRIIREWADGVGRTVASCNGNGTMTTRQALALALLALESMASYSNNNAEWRHAAGVVRELLEMERERATNG